MFSDNRDVNKPDLSSLSEHIHIDRNDGILTTGISFKKHVDKKIYPSLPSILSQLPEPIEKLTLGGFHINDCVDKLAGYAYSIGIDTIVDEDTTNFFFDRTSICGEIPLIRRDFTPEGLGIDREMIDLVIEARKNKPWRWSLQI